MTACAPYVSVDRCRSCGAGPFHVLHEFGLTPIADRLINPDGETPDLGAPLTFALCPDCGLAQIRETVAPRYLFSADYPYYSSVSSALTAHFHQSADNLIAKLGLGADSLVVEAASNDGYMLRRFKDAGIPVLGIDPSDGPVDVARGHGVETIHGFFDCDCAAGIISEGRRADLFLANNVLAHVADTNDFVAGISTVLSDDGVAVIEFPYLIDLVDHCAFDTIYHQHLLYLSLSSVAPIFARHGLYVNDAERTAVHGGSLRITVSRRRTTTAALDQLMQQEAERQIGEPAFFDPMLRKMREVKSEFRDLIDTYLGQGMTLAGYGAAAKATTFLHHFDIGGSELAFIADKNDRKQGLLMPGTGIPIVAPDAVITSGIDALVILAWNFANEIMAENADFAAKGGVFIVPVPDLVVTQGAQLRAAL